MAWFKHLASEIYFEETGSGDPVLLLPGFSDRVENHNALREALDRNYRVITADLPGSGRSLPQPRNYHPGYYLEDAQAFIALLEHIDVTTAHILGFSDGGEVALLIAAIKPNAARSVLTWGAQGSIIDPDGQIVSFFRDVVDSRDPASAGYRDYLVATYGEGNARAMTQNFAGALAAIEQAGGDICRGRASNIVCPALLLAGQQDPFIKKSAIDEMASHMPIAETIEVAAAGHGIHEEQPVWFAATVIDWLAKSNQQGVTL